MSRTIKKSSDSFSCKTTQELKLKQILTTLGIPFEYQKRLTFPDRSYVVDFFLASYLILECSQTWSLKYDVALRQKAILLEAKCSYLKRFHAYPIWVLFESARPIGELFCQTLERLMPSIDRILLSISMFLENLQGYFRKNQNFPPHKRAFSASFSASSPKNDSHTKNHPFPPHNSSIQNLGAYIWSERSNSKGSSPILRQFSSMSPNRPPINYSYIMKKILPRDLRYPCHE
jgi:hypothetical protein